MRVRTILAAVLICAVAVSATGCDRIKQAFTPPAPGTVTHSATVAAVGAPVVGKVTKGFPNDIPLWPNSSVDKTRKVDAPNGTAWRAVFYSQDPYDTVLKGVGVGFQRAGWQVSSVSAGTTDTPSDVLSAAKDNTDIVITLSKSTKPVVGTRIEYVITSQ